MELFSFALGIGTRDSKDNWLEVYYPRPSLRPPAELMDQIAEVCGYTGGNRAIEPDKLMLSVLLDVAGRAADKAQAELLTLLLQSSRPVVATFLETDAAPACVPELYLKLHLLSHRLVEPHGLALDGMFALLPNVAWTNRGAIAVDELPMRQFEARLNGELLEVFSVDKFPKMSDYVVPAGVRIADAARVRLGAYLGEGTTVMHEGFVNFNAGTQGKAMIEGRVSAGVTIGHGSDLGGGASILGTLSGGNKTVISVGRDCLVGANAGLGIPLGDRCIVEAGLYLTAGTKVTVLDNEGVPVEVMKARELAGTSDLLFRRNSVTGTVECLTNKTRVELNAQLHANN